MLFDIWLHLRDEIHEAGQRLIRLVPHMAKLNHHLLFQLVINDGDSEGGGFIGQEASIVSALQMKLQVWGEIQEKPLTIYFKKKKEKKKVSVKSNFHSSMLKGWKWSLEVTSILISEMFLQFPVP